MWGAVLPSEPPPALPSALPGMFAGEQYDEPQRHALFVFRYLLVFVAAVQSFAHGANDTANATGVAAYLHQVPMFVVALVCIPTHTQSLILECPVAVG